MPLKLYHPLAELIRFIFDSSNMIVVNNPLAELTPLIFNSSDGIVINIADLLKDCKLCLLFLRFSVYHHY